MTRNYNYGRVYREECEGFVLMLEPKEGCTHKAANALARCKGVTKVDLMEGACAIMVHGKDTIALNKVIAEARKFGDASNFGLKRISYRRGIRT